MEEMEGERSTLPNACGAPYQQPHPLSYVFMYIEGLEERERIKREREREEESGTGQEDD
jgi:hypothetical protein